MKNNRKRKGIAFDQYKNESIGKAGTKERDEYEAEVKLEIELLEEQFDEKDYTDISKE